MARWMVALLLLALPLAAGQAHDHGAAERAPLAIVLDVGGDEVLAGDPARFQVVVFGDDGVPDPHQDLRIEVEFGGRLLLATTAASGHDYDGVNVFEVTFPGVGPYTARVLDDAGQERARLDGWAVASELPSVDANGRMDGPVVAVAGQPAPFRFWPEDEAGLIIPHFYTLLEVRGESGLLYRAKLHGHEPADLGPAEVELSFPLPGTYTVEGTIYQASPYGPQNVAFAPLRVSQQVQVLAGPPPSPSPFPAIPSASPVRASGQDGLELLGTFDPSPQVGPGTLQHLVVLAEREGRLSTHNDFTVNLTGPLGNTLFASRFLHESDGILELATTQPLPGVYSLHVDQGGRGAIDLAYAVVPADDPTSIGPQTLSVKGLEGARSSVPQALEVSIADAAGRPLAHSEVDLQILGPDGLPVVTAKLHTHGDGRFAVTITPLEAGLHTLRLVPFTLESRPVSFPDGPAVALFDVAEGEPWPPAQDQPVPLPASNDPPGLAWAPLLASGFVVLIGALLVRPVLRRLR